MTAYAVKIGETIFPADARGVRPFVIFLSAVNFNDTTVLVNEANNHPIIFGMGAKYIVVEKIQIVVNAANSGMIITPSIYTGTPGGTVGYAVYGSEQISTAADDIFSWDDLNIYCQSSAPYAAVAANSPLYANWIIFSVTTGTYAATDDMTIIAIQGRLEY